MYGIPLEVYYSAIEKVAEGSALKNAYFGSERQTPIESAWRSKENVRTLGMYLPLDQGQILGID